MNTNKLSEKVKKNLLDVYYHRYLQYFNTTIIISFTYLIGVAIAFITKQISYKDSRQLFLIAVISIGFLGVMVILLLNNKIPLICDEWLKWNFVCSKTTCFKWNFECQKPLAYICTDKLMPPVYDGWFLTIQRTYR